MSKHKGTSRRAVVGGLISAMGGLIANSAFGAMGKTAESRTPLKWQYFPMDDSGFYHTPALLTGPTEAVLLDGVFTWSQGQMLVDAIKATGKRLTTIYISCNDPDFFFGLAPVLRAFPEAKFIGAPATVAAMEEVVEVKLKIWAKKLNGNGPSKRSELTLPQPFAGDTLLIDGRRIEIVTTPNMFDRRYYWVPDLLAVFGSDLIISGLHVWMADTPSHEAIRAWVTALDEITARKPLVVVPGHMSKGSTLGLATVQFTREYLVAFEQERAVAKNSKQLIDAMERRYPTLLGTTSLELGAKVVMGDVHWGRGV